MPTRTHPKRYRMDLGDDGTLDTVYVCSACGREYRFNFDGEGSYAQFKTWARSEARDAHDTDIEEAGVRN